jgi:surfactin synthase thioesterase subunit
MADPELLQAILPALRADMEAYETYAYVPAPPLDCPITAFGGDKDAIASAEDLAAWREQTTAAFAVHLFHGGHFYFESDPGFFTALSALLAESVQGESGPR